MPRRTKVRGADQKQRLSSQIVDLINRKEAIERIHLGKCQGSCPDSGNEEKQVYDPKLMALLGSCGAMSLR